MRLRKHSLHHPSNSQFQPVRATNLRLERWHRTVMYGVMALLSVSGMLWLAAHYWFPVNNEFGANINPLEPWSIKLHGAAAMGALFFVGSLLNSHIRRAHKTRRNFYSGWSMIVLLGTLTLSGYGLYYLTSETSRPLWSNLHWIGGLTLPALLILHIVLGRRARAKLQAS
jgi:hypothetical protein